MTYPINKIRFDFPILSRKIHGHPLTYLDSAASSQNPKVVLDCKINFYRNRYAAVHRGIHTLSSEATNQMENVRVQIAKFINASSSKEIIFVKGTTEGINLVANAWGRKFLKPGDNIILTEMEHHANIVPWQMLSKDKKIEIRFIPILPNGTLDINSLPKLIDDNTRFFSIIHISNVLGTQNPISEIIAKVRTAGNIIVLVDGAQYIMHHKVNVQKLDCDFYVFSGHKMYGPSGTGVLYGKKELLESMPPWQGGGSMIRKVSLTKETTYTDVPWRFEAGSPNTSGIIGLGSAVSYINSIGIDRINTYENQLMKYALESIQKIPEIILYGPSNDRTGVISFNLGSHHAYDVGSFLDQYGIAIRTGHHCAMPIMDRFNVSSMCRASLALYTNREDIDRLVNALTYVNRLLS